MTPTARSNRLARLCLGVLLGFGVLTGCQVVNNPAERVHFQEPVPVAREMDYVNLPTYRIEPPDILLIDALRIVPKSPYLIEPNDSLFINVSGTLPTQPINGAFLVDPGGLVDLGPGYGKVKLSGLGLDDAILEVEKHLQRVLREPQVSISLALSGGQQQVLGDRLVGPDGRITLGTYGTVYVAGMTIEEATDAITKHLSHYLEDPVISVDIFAYNSKVFYVVSEGGIFGDQFQRFPITGKETVLDAVQAVGGLSRVSNKKIWIARPNPGHDCDQILPVEWDDIVKGGQTKTNYQLMTGDRVIIEDNRWGELDGMLTRVLGPFERLLNFTVLGTSAVQNNQRFPGGLGPGVGGNFF